MTSWLILTATLPTKPSALRVRVWRALKATGAAALREGVYVLPASAPTAPALWDIERTIAAAEADAHMLAVDARDDAQERAFRALFDRTDLYAELLQAVRQARGGMRKASEVTLRKTLRGLDQQLRAVQAGDFFPGPAAGRAVEAYAALRRAVDLRSSPDEPGSVDAAIEHRRVEDFQGRTWATRRRPWIDRLATAWLVMRQVDRNPKFIWLADPARCPRGALGYDYDGATLTHTADKVTFEVVAASFGLDTDAGIRSLGDLVHAIDVGGGAHDAAPGVEAVVRGLQACHADDDALLAAAVPLFDALYAGLQEPP